MCCVYICVCVCVCFSFPTIFSKFSSLWTGSLHGHKMTTVELSIQSWQDNIQWNKRDFFFLCNSHYYYYIGGPCHTACGILVPWTGVKTMPPALEDLSLHCWWLLLFSCVQLFCKSIDCNLPGFSVHKISQARILEWIAISYSRGFSRPRDQTFFFCIAGRFITTEPPERHLNHWTVREVPFQSVQSLSCARSLQPHRPQHAKLPCPSPTPRAFSNSCPLSRWCHSTISSSVVPFSSCLQSFPASGSFPLSQFFQSMAKVLKFQLQHQSFQRIFRTDFL